MKYSELITRAARQSRESYTDANWLLWINDWLQDMAQVAQLVATATIALTTGTLAYSPPTGCQKLLRLFLVEGTTKTEIDLLGDSDVDSCGYHLWNDKITLQEVTFTSTDTLFAVYHRSIAAVTVLTVEIVDIPVEHQNCGVFYLCARAYSRERWQDTSFFAQYLGGKQAFGDSRGHMRRIRARAWC